MKFIKRFISEFDNVDEVGDGSTQFSGIVLDTYFAKLLESVKPGCTDYDLKYFIFDPWEGTIEYIYYTYCAESEVRSPVSIKFDILTVTLEQIKDEA